MPKDGESLVEPLHRAVDTLQTLFVHGSSAGGRTTIPSSPGWPEEERETCREATSTRTVYIRVARAVMLQLVRAQQPLLIVVMAF